jgi:hypothetical protein
VTVGACLTTSIALIPRNVIDLFIKSGYSRQGNSETEFGLWVNGNDNKPENALPVLLSYNYKLP